MDLLNKYLEKLTFTRVDEKAIDNRTYVVYGAGIEGDLGAGKQRYVLLFVPSHLAIKSQARATELPWCNLQTRTMTYGYRLKRQQWTLSDDLPNFHFYIKERTNKSSEYAIPEFPFEVLLLHDPKKKTKYQFYDKMNLYSIMVSFSSVFNYIGDENPIHYTSGETYGHLPSPVNLPYGSFNIFKPSTWLGQQPSQLSSIDPPIDDDFDLL